MWPRLSLFGANKNYGSIPLENLATDIENNELNKGNGLVAAANSCRGLVSEQDVDTFLQQIDTVPAASQNFLDILIEKRNELKKDPLNPYCLGALDVSVGLLAGVGVGSVVAASALVFLSLMNERNFFEEKNFVAEFLLYCLSVFGVSGGGLGAAHTLCGRPGYPDQEKIQRLTDAIDTFNKILRLEPVHRCLP